MGGPLSFALPARSVATERAGAAVETAAPFLLGALAPGLLAADQGGFWPTTWGWAALALAWAGAIALVLRERRPGSFELWWVAGLLAVTGWTVLSFLWTDSRTQTALEVERTLVYLAAAVAAVAIVRSRDYRTVVWGVWAGSTFVCCYALATRLVPERLGVVDTIAGYRLAAPIGYWNGLGILAATAAILAVGLAAHGRPIGARALAAASLPVLLPTLYFTFSRGGWLALAAGLLAGLALSARRVALLANAALQALPAGAAMWLCYRARELRLTDVPIARAEHVGHTLLWQLPLLALAAAALALLAAQVSRVPEVLRSAFVVLVTAAAIAGCVIGIRHYGGPTAAWDRARASLEHPPPQANDLNTRLLSLSLNGRLPQWRVALDEWRAHRVLGGGAGTYAQNWSGAGRNQGHLLDAHNLYLETLGELGVVGLALLAGTLLAPLAAAVREREAVLVPIAGAAYVAWLVHAAFEWDWELPGVTIGPVLLAGAILAAARRARPSPQLRFGLVALACAVGVFAFIGLLGNRALASSGSALDRGNLKAALAAADDARRWAPWSSQPWQQVAAVRIAAGDAAGARNAYRRAVAKDPDNWELWFGLARFSHGAERQHALARLAVLNPAARG